MVEQTQKPEPAKTTGKSDLEVIMMMLQEMREDINRFRQEEREERQKYKEEIIGAIESLRENMEESRREFKEEIIKSLREDNEKQRQ